MPITVQRDFPARSWRHYAVTQVFLGALMFGAGASAEGVYGYVSADDGSAKTIVSADYVSSPDDSCIVAARGNTTGEVSYIHTIVYTEDQPETGRRATLVDADLKSFEKEGAFIVTSGEPARGSATKVSNSPQGSLIACRLEAAAWRASRENQPGNAIKVMRGEDVLLRTAFGRADLELGVPLSPDMVFRIASLTKQFTAVAVLKLHEQQKLSIDDRLAVHFPEFPAHVSEITIRQLMHQTSGLNAAHTHERNDYEVKELLDLFINEPLAFAPGEKFEYNNNNYNVLGALIERVSGVSYGEFLDKELFRPLGLDDTALDDYRQIVVNRANGYQGSEDEPRNASFVSMTIPYAAGALISSVDDMAKWNRALFGGRVVNAQSLKEMTTSAVGAAPGGHDHGHHDGGGDLYGFGLFIGEIEGHAAYGHSGAVEGFLSYNLYIPDEEISVTVLRNTSSFGNPQNLAVELAKIAMEGAE